jgi:N-methylhydantoinase B
VSDKATAEVVRAGLVAAAEQMATVIERSARSPVIREMLDYSTAVFDLSGGIVAQSCRIPMHLNSMTRALRMVLERRHPITEWEDGDIFATNDPYLGGQHLPDVMTFSPVFANGDRVAICGTLGHQIDIGGRATASYGADATEVFQEGFRISGSRIADKGTFNRLFFELLSANIRVPEKTLADLQAQIAALEIGKSDIRRLVKRYGVQGFFASLADLVAQSETRMRQVIGTLPEGVFVGEDWVDGDGLDDDPIRVYVTVKRLDADLVIDFTGTADQVRGPINCPLAATESAAYYAVISMLAPDVPTNYGCYLPIRVIAPEGTVVNPREPAAVVGRNVLTHRIANVVTAALSSALPERAVAAYYGNSNVYIFSQRGGRGERKVIFEIEVGGWGASSRRDGHDCLSAGIHNLMNVPIELTEQDFPVRIVSYSLRADSGGAGHYRGGLGVTRVVEVLEDCEFSCQFDRMKFPPLGWAGGSSGAPARITVIHDGEERQLPGKVLAIPLVRGDRVVLETQGGGGFGDPATRDRSAIERDVAEGKVTRPVVEVPEPAASAPAPAHRSSVPVEA